MINKDNLINYLFSLAVLLNIVNVFSSVYKMSQYVSLSIFIQFVLTILTFLLILKKASGSPGKRKLLVLVGLILGISFFSILISHTGVTGMDLTDIEYYTKYFLFSSLIMSLFVASKMNASHHTIRLIILANLIISLWFVYNYLSGNKIYFQNMLTMGFPNPNFTGIWIAQLVFVKVCALFYFRNGFVRILFICLIVPLIPMLIETQARTSIVAVVAFFVISVLVYTFNIKSIYKPAISLFVITPIIIPTLYIFLTVSQIQRLIWFLETEVKSADSRYFIWMESLRIIGKHPVFGNYGELVNQMHNTHLEVLALFGFAVFMLFVYYLYIVLVINNKRSLSSFNIIAMVAFISTTFIGIGESAIVAGGQGIYYIYASYIIFANYNISRPPGRNTLKGAGACRSRTFCGDSQAL